jgi:alkylhydroperoxidase family enzyme
MIGMLVRHQIRTSEKRLGVPLDYLRHIYEHAPDTFWKFTKFLPLAQYRSKLPPAPYHVARLVAIYQDDCSHCLQIAVNLAKEDGIEPAILTAVLNRSVEQLPESLQDVYRFTEAVVNHRTDIELFRERLRKVFGQEALVELAMAIATSRVFPTLKRALGYSQSCSLSPVDV